MDYQTLTNKEICHALKESNVCFLSTSLINIPYTIPMFYDLREKDGDYLFIVHSYHEGRLIESLCQNDKVCLLIVNQNNRYVDSIVASGIVELSNANCNDIIIKIKVMCISGRRYCQN